MNPPESTASPSAPPAPGAQGPKLSEAAQRALLVVFGVITVLDVLSFRSLYFTVHADQQVVHKAVFERDEGRVVARAVAWHYPMMPQPVAYDVRTVQQPPGYPLLFNTGARDATGEGPGLDGFVLRVYEQPAVALFMIRPAGEAAFQQLTVDETGQPLVKPVGATPPPIADAIAVDACFGESAGEERLFELSHPPSGPLSVEAGRCRWEIATASAEVLITSQASARVEMSGTRDVGDHSFELLIFLLVVLGSLVSRWALRGVSFFLTDAVATLFVFALSFFSPMWLLLWGLKAAAGVGVLAWRALKLIKDSRRAQLIAAGAGVVALIAALVVDPVRAAAWYTALMADMQIAAMESKDDREESPIEEASHLVLGYSTVNAAAAGRGAYGSAALDRVLQARCGEGRTFARHGTDGANICMMAETWNAVTVPNTKLQARVFVGGFNDDIAPSLKSLRTVIPSFLALVPAADPFPRVEKAWAETANANVNVKDNVDRAIGCIEQVATQGGPSHFIYVYDLGIFDLGTTRGYGRDQWETYRRDVVEKAGGRFVDLRDLLPGESLTYFNDFVHPSEVGYELMADALCKGFDGEVAPTEPADGESSDAAPPQAQPTP